MIEVELANGRRLVREASLARGNPERPLTDEELSEKFRQCAAETLVAPRVEEALALAWRLDELGRLDGLLEALTA